MPRRTLAIAVLLLTHAPAFAADPVTLEWQFPQGRVFMYKCTRAIVSKGAQGQVTATVEYTFEETVTAAPEDSPAMISVKVDHVKVDVQMPKERLAYDSAKPKKLKEGESPTLVAYANLAGQKFHITVARTGEIGDTSDLEALQVGDAALPPTIVAEILEFLKFQFSGIPTGSMEVKGSWAYDVPLPMSTLQPGAPDLTESVQATLKALGSKKGHKTAEIEMKPSLGSPDLGGGGGVEPAGGQGGGMGAAGVGAKGNKRGGPKLNQSGSGSLLWATDTGYLVDGNRQAKVDASGGGVSVNVDVKRTVELLNKP